MRLETNGYYALGAPLYLLLAAGELLLIRHRRAPGYAFADTISNLSAGLGEVVIGLFLGPLLIALYDFGYAHLALFHFAPSSPIPWILAFVAGDFCYYWYHRAGHRVAALWAIHGVHHQSERFNLTIALRHPWFSDSYFFLFYIPMPLLGVPPTHFFVAITLISFYALTIHSLHFRRPSLGVFVVPETHILHHAINRRYLGKNYGALFNVWDRLFGTYAAPDPADPPRLGTLSGYETHDGARSQWILFRNVLSAARRARTVGEALRALFGPPGWSPRERPPRPRAEAEIPIATRIYVSIQFTAAALFALFLLARRDACPRWLLAASALLVLWTLSTLGGLLDGRPSAPRHERYRLAAALALALAF